MVQDSCCRKGCKGIEGRGVARKFAKLEVEGSKGCRGILFLDERMEDCSDSHHSRAAGAIPATPTTQHSR